MFKNKTVLITGPTEGIGRDLTDLFAQSGARLILVSRNINNLNNLKKTLEETYHSEVFVFSLDLSRNGSTDQLIQNISHLNLDVDVLVNNAGYGVYGDFSEEDIDPQIGMIELHVASTTKLVRTYLPHMLENKVGGVLNVASTAAFQPLPLQNVYGATKSYLLHFTEALAQELNESGISITCLCPGPTETPFFDKPHMKQRTHPKIPRMSSQKVARLGFEGFKKGKVLIIPGFGNKILVFLTRFAPRSILRKAAHKMIRKVIEG